MAESVSDQVLKKKNRRVSSVDVAKEAGVSQATVSRVFNRKKGINVSPETVDRIMKAAEMLNYRPSGIARSLQEKTTNIIGIINRNFNSPFHTKSLELFSRELQKRGFTTLLLNISEDSPLDDILPLALEYQVDGIILTSVSLSSDLAEECVRYGTPVVEFNRYSMSPHIDSVCLDNFRAGYDSADFLLKNNHRKLVYISGDIDSSTNKDRYMGFSKRLKEDQMTLFDEFAGELSYYAGLEAADYFLSGSQEPERPDAVFCASDIEAFGFIDGARDRYGLSIPEDISVIGFDDTPMASWPRYGLTTFAHPAEEMVEEAISVLCNAIKYEKTVNVFNKIPGELIIRKTVKDRN